MLDNLRSFAKSWPGKVMGGFLLVGLAGFGVNNVIGSLGSNTVAHVGNQEISTRDFARAYQNKINQFANQIGRMPTAEEAESFGIPSVVIGELAQNAALEQLATNYGLGVSDTKLGEKLRKDSNFSGTLGNFDPKVFTDALRRSGITEADYFATQSKIASREQLVLSLFGDAELPVAASELINRYIGDQRSVDYFVISDTTVPAPAAPTDADLAAYLTAHQTEFRTVETRAVQVLVLSPQTLADTKTIAYAEIEAEYERTKASLVKPERRTVEQVILADAAQAELFAAGKTSGKTFAALLTETGLAAAEIGTFSKPEVTDTALADAAFGLVGDDFVIIDGAVGKRAIHVSLVDLGGQVSFDDAKADIAKTLALAAAKKEIADIQDQIEELRAAFKPLKDIADRFALKLHDVALTADGTALSAVEAIGEDDRAKVSETVFKAEAGKLTPSVALSANGNLWFDLSKVDPARDQTLDEVRDALATAWTAEKVEAAIAEAAAAVVVRLDAGEAIADIATSLNTFPQLSGQFTRSGETDTPIDSVVAAAVFAGGDSLHGSVVNQQGEHIVFNLVNLIPATGPLAAAAATSIANDQRDDMFGQFVTGVRDDAGLKINQQALMQALALNSGN